MTGSLSAIPANIPTYSGDAIILSLTVTNTGDVGAIVRAPPVPNVSGSVGVALATGPSPGTTLTIAGGAAQTFTWVYTVTGGAGTVSFSASGNGRDAVSGTPVTTGMLSAGPVTVSALSPPCPLQAFPSPFPIYMDFYDRDDRAMGVVVDPSGSIYAVAQDDQSLCCSEGTNIRVIVRAPDGGIGPWPGAYNSGLNTPDIGYGIARDPVSGSFFVAGSADGVFWTASADQGGKYGWMNFYQPSATLAEARGIAVDQSGSVYVAGWAMGPGTGRDVVLIKYDSLGNTLWISGYDSPAHDDDYGYGVAVDSSGGVFVVGAETRSDLTQGRNIILLKFDPAGSLLWSRSSTSPGNRNDEGRAVAVGPDGSICVAGFETRSDLGQGENGWVRKYDSAGTPLWTKTFNGPLVYPGGPNERAYGIGVDAVGSVHVVGQQMLALATGTDVMIRRYDAQGNLREVRIENGVANQNDAGTGVAFDGAGNVFVSGWMWKSVSQNEDAWIQKYSSPYCLHAALAVEQPVVSTGQPFFVYLTVTNTGGNTINGVTPSLWAGPGVSFMNGPYPAPPVALAPGTSQTFSWQYSAVSAGAESFTATVTGQDSSTGEDLKAFGKASLSVVVRSYLSASIACPTLVCEGVPFAVTMTLTNTGDASALGVSASLFGDGFPAMRLVSAPGTVASLTGGGSTTLTWTYSAYGSATGSFHGHVYGTDQYGWTSDGTTTAYSSSMMVGDAVSLTVAVSGPASPVPVGEWFTLTMTVSNTGTNPATGVTPALAVGPGAGLTEPIGTASPPGPVDIPGGGMQAFTWTRSVSAGGRPVFTLSATGTDACKTMTVSATVGVDAGLPAALAASPLTLAPDPACVGGTVTAVLAVTNTGQVAASAVTGSPDLFTEGAATRLSAPPVLPSLGPGASALLTWVYTPGSAGALKFTASVAGTDSRDGAPLATGPAPSNTVTVVAPGALSAAALAPSLAVIGQTIVTTLTVTNTGDANADDIFPSATVAPARAALTGGPSPGGPVSLVPGAGQTFSWTWLVTSAGSMVFTVSAQGTTCSGMPVTARLSRTVTAAAPAQLSIESVVLSPSAVSVGSAVTATLTLKNTGGSPLTVTGVSRTATGSLVNQPSFSLLSPLAGGASMSVSWVYSTAGACGPGKVGISVGAVADVTGATLFAGPRDSNQVALATVPVALAFSSPVATADVGKNVTLSAGVTDACGQGVPGAQVSVVVTGGGGSVFSALLTTNAQGLAPVVFTTGLEPGTNTVWAMVVGYPLSGTVTIEGINPLALTEPGAALNVNTFDPDKGEIVIGRIYPKNDDPIALRVYTASARLVRYLRLPEPMGKGQYMITWDGRNEEGERVARGVYIIRVEGGGIKELLKVVVK